MTSYSIYPVLLACGVVPLFLPTSGESGTFNVLRKEVAALRARLRELHAEIALLRHSVLTLEVERHQANIRAIETEIDHTRAEQARLVRLETARQQELQEFDELIANADHLHHNRHRVDSARVKLAVVRARELAAESETARVRESELLQLLRAEEESVKRLIEAGKLIRGAIQ